MRVLFFLALCLMAVLAKYKGGADLPPDSDLRIGVKVSGTALRFSHVARVWRHMPSTILVADL